MIKNEPDLWITDFPRPCPQDHKYSRGQVVALGGMHMTGAACLAADAAARVGAGLVTLLSPRVSLRKKLTGHDPYRIYKAFRPYMIVRQEDAPHHFIKTASHKGCVACIAGPGLGDKDYTALRKTVIDILKTQTPAVLDADALNAFEGQYETLKPYLHEQVILTPHEGEFKKLFPDLSEKLRRDRAATAMDAANYMNGATLILKGYETLIVKKGTTPVMNQNASPYLATAGAGDVLAGLCGGLLSQGMPCFNAACASVWMHGNASKMLGPGMVAEDIVKIIPKVLKEMLGIREKVG